MKKRALKKAVRAAELRVEFAEAHAGAQADYITHLLNDPSIPLGRYARLIRWLAVPWADRDPLFPLTEFRKVDGLPAQILTTNSDLASTWSEVVRGVIPPKSPATAEEQATPG